MFPLESFFIYCPYQDGWGPFAGPFLLDFSPCFEIVTFLFLSQILMFSYGTFALLKISTHFFKIVQFLTENYSFSIFNALTSIIILQLAATIQSMFCIVKIDMKTRTNSSFLQLYWSYSAIVSAIMLHTEWRLLGYSLIFTITYFLAFKLILYLSLALIEVYQDKSFIQYRFQHVYMAVNDHNPSQFPEFQSFAPEDAASFFSKITFSWLNPLLSLAFTPGGITEKNLLTLPKMCDTNLSFLKFSKYWSIEMETSRKSLFMALFKSFGGWYIISGIYKFIYDLLIFMNPILLKSLLTFVSSYVSERPIHPAVGFYYAFAILVVNVLQNILIHQSFNLTYKTGLAIRSALVTAIYTKSMVLSNKSRSLFNSGDVSNRMSIDTQRISDFLGHSHPLWSSPFQVIIALYLLYQTLGWSSYTGVAIMILVIPINTILASITQDLQEKQMKSKDGRAHFIEESLQGIKVLKLYAWETPFLERIRIVRNMLELEALRKIGLVYCFQTIIIIFVPFLVTFATFIVYYKFDNQSRGPLNSSLIFVSLTLFNMLQFPLILFPYSLTLFIEAKIGIFRIRDFLISEELEKNSVIKLKYDRKSAKDGAQNSKSQSLALQTNISNIEQDSSHQTNKSTLQNISLVVVENADLWWEYGSEFSVPTLKDISLRVKSNELLAVVGRVGSGKSSLLLSLTGELYKSRGCISTKGTIAYACQQTWIMNATLRENILFGKKYRPNFYQKVIFACGLTADLSVLENGDLTEIGEKGINLSGGQKARVGLARAVYSCADIYLLDDPLAAVDAHVGAHIFRYVLGPNGLLRNYARIFVTNAIPYLESCDSVVLMQDGYIVEQGDYDSLINENGLLTALVRDYGSKKQNISGVSTPTILHEGSNKVGSLGNLSAISDVNCTDSTTNTCQGIFDEYSENSFLKDDVEEILLNRRGSCSLFSNRSASINSETATKSPKLQGQLMTIESSKIGKVSSKIYMDYIRSCGVISFTVYIITLVLSEALIVISTAWLKFWAVSNEKGEDFTFYYLGIYLLLGLLFSLFAGIRAYTFMSVCTINSAKITHEKMLSSVFASPMQFFDTTPLGRIINRFSRDQAIIDEELPQSLNAVSKSPIYQHFQESFDGVTTIRSYLQTDRFIKKNQTNLNENQKPIYTHYALNRWIALRLDFMSSIMIFSIALISVSILVFYKDSKFIDSGVVGMTISYALIITQSLNWCIRMYCKVETDIISVERVEEYSNLTPELTNKTEYTRVVDTQDNSISDFSSWPKQGRVEFINYSTRYRENLDLVLKDINIEIKSGEKIGIIGRTGSGKSSFTLGLFRIIEPINGKILIDGLDITKISLYDLRSSICIIPQDPVLFSGTIRFNLFPFSSLNESGVSGQINIFNRDIDTADSTLGHSYSSDSQVRTENIPSDSALWNALELVNLKDFVNNLEGGLDAPLTRFGDNFSVGQKQLVCLARALIRRSKILVLDEATASIDPETDEIIQKTINTSFKESTVITIAHRLNTVFNSNRILVLSDGRVVEYDTPEALMKDETSALTSFAKQYGLTMSPQ
ncbi:hypothetical protein BB561_004277 [Smittium simulii]|uniref:Metal resistance protein YCF1 n=1 Tax=Smittium simulii TaxID=133385 RepID=A0A2T9YH68_9FUNG|nr:hypothetical protein BB561_004277 [Smittium simulii]